jgi:hypothetical protein
MRPYAAVLAVPLLLAPIGVSAQPRLAVQTARAAAAIASERAELRRPIVSVAPVMLAGEDDDSTVAIQRAGERIADRLKPLEERLQHDDRLRRAGAVVGVGAVALGALKGAPPLTFAGTQAIRMGLHNQLTAVERRSGFTVQPSIVHRGVSVTVSRTFE